MFWVVGSGNSITYLSNIIIYYHANINTSRAAMTDMLQKNEHPSKT